MRWRRPPPRSRQAPVEGGQARDRPEGHGAVRVVLHPDEGPDRRRPRGRVGAAELLDLGGGKPGDPSHALGRVLGEARLQPVEAQRVPLDVVRVVERVAHDHVHHPQGEGGVGARPRADVPVGLLRRARAQGVDDHEPGALLLRLEDEGPPVGVRDRGVGAPDHDEPAPRRVLGQHSQAGADRGRHPLVAGAAADVALQPRGAQPGEEAGGERVHLDEALGPGVAVGQDGGRPVLRDDLLQAVRHLAERLVPGDPLEAALRPSCRLAAAGGGAGRG